MKHKKYKFSNCYSYHRFVLCNKAKTNRLVFNVKAINTTNESRCVIEGHQLKCSNANEFVARNETQYNIYCEIITPDLCCCIAVLNCLNNSCLIASCARYSLYRGYCTFMLAQIFLSCDPWQTIDTANGIELPLLLAHWIRVIEQFTQQILGAWILYLATKIQKHFYIFCYMCNFWFLA